MIFNVHQIRAKLSGPKPRCKWIVTTSEEMGEKKMGESMFHLLEATCVFLS